MPEAKKSRRPFDPLISDDVLDSLPDDPEAALVALVNAVNDSASNWAEFNWDWRSEFVTTLQGFLNEYDIEVPKSLLRPISIDSDSYSQEFDNFKIEISRLYSQFRFRTARLNSESSSVSLKLGKDYRTEIHEYIEKIREIVRVTDIPIDKRDRIFKQVSKLSLEVDRDRSNPQALLALIVEVSGTSGKVAENLEPVADLADKIVTVLGKAKAESLQKLLEGPRKMLPPPEKDELDDEIPF